MQFTQGEIPAGRTVAFTKVSDVRIVPSVPIRIRHERVARKASPSRVMGPQPVAEERFVPDLSVLPKDLIVQNGVANEPVSFRMQHECKSVVVKFPCDIEDEVAKRTVRIEIHHHCARNAVDHPVGQRISIRSCGDRDRRLDGPVVLVESNGIGNRLLRAVAVQIAGKHGVGACFAGIDVVLVCAELFDPDVFGHRNRRVGNLGRLGSFGRFNS